MTGRNAKSRHEALMGDLARDDDSPPGTPAAASPRAHPDSSVPALGTTGELLRAELQSARDKAATLQQEVEALRAAPAERSMPARLIRHGKFRDRHELGFKDAKFEELKASIEKEGGNKQPILVRPLAQTDAEGHTHEVVWGHRRHRACLELGRDVNMIERELTDLQAAELMTIENKHREPLSQFELARKYKVWLDEGLYENQQAIAAREALSQGTISRIMAINDLPPEVVDRLEDPRKISAYLARSVLPLLEKDRAGVLKRLDAAEGKLTPKALLDLVEPTTPLEPRELSVGDRRILQALPTRNAAGKVIWSTLKLHVPLDDAQVEKLAAFVAKL